MKEGCYTNYIDIILLQMFQMPMFYYFYIFILSSCNMEIKINLVSADSFVVIIKPLELVQSKF